MTNGTASQNVLVLRQLRRSAARRTAAHLHQPDPLPGLRIALREAQGVLLEAEEELDEFGAIAVAHVCSRIERRIGANAKPEEGGVPDVIS